MVECGLPKAETRVRFPSPAPFISAVFCAAHIFAAQNFNRNELGAKVKTGFVLIAGRDFQRMSYPGENSRMPAQDFLEVPGNTRGFFLHGYNYIPSETAATRPFLALAGNTLGSCLKDC